MAKLPECDRCLFCAHDYHIVCALHPFGLQSDSCLDFRPDPQLEGKKFVDFLGLGEQPPDDEAYSNPFDLDPDLEQWEPEGARFVGGELVIERIDEAQSQQDRSFYNGEEIVQPHRYWTREEMLELLNSHPLFTEKCPKCRASIEIDYNIKRIHFDCDYCGWVDDSV